ncbi:MAG: hypothetical protein NTU63_02500 [Candidatus Pacearchaeota archaeon]|nr:hypothetical protein [Candidatus Pacearchaeota archaeon]
MAKKLEKTVKEEKPNNLERFGHYLLDVMGTIMDGRTMHHHKMYNTSRENKVIHPYFSY